jgi:hypothetical protein
MDTPQTPGNQRYEAGREAAIKAAQNIANACNLINIHPCDMREVTRLQEEAKELRIKSANLGFTIPTP